MRYSELNRDDKEPGINPHEPLSSIRKMFERLPAVPQLYPCTSARPESDANGAGAWSWNSRCPVDVFFCGGDRFYKPPIKGHSHFEIYYLLSGSAICHVNGKSLPFEEGDLAFIGSTPDHRIESGMSTPSRLAALVFDPDLIRCDGGSDGTEYLAPFLVQGSEFPHVIVKKTGVPNEVLELMLRIRSELPASSQRASLAVRTYLKMLLVLLLNQYSTYAKSVEMFQQQQCDIERLRPVFQYLADNCGKAIRVGDAARMCCMCESQFAAFFRQVTGSSFMKYLTQYRIQRAKDLLVNTDRSIADISLDSGYCDQSYFGAVFHKLVGATPAAYRRHYEKRPILAGHPPDPSTTEAVPMEISPTSLPARHGRTGARPAAHEMPQLYI